MNSAFLKIICMIVATMSYMPSFAAEEFAELGIEKLFDIVKAVTPNASTLRTALDKVNENVEQSLPSSMMDEAALKQLEDDTTKLNMLVPKPLSSINNKETIERIARGTKNPGTLTGASEELQRLERAGRLRSAEIDRLKLLRDDLKALRSKYEDTAEAARKLSNKIGELASNPTVEFYGRLSGKSVALSWADFETEFVPALQKRQEAAERALTRLNDVISSSEKDLHDFNDSRMFANEIFAQHLGSATGLDASAVPGTGTVKLGEIGRTMEEDTKATMELSEKMRKEASEIRKWNAGLSKFQSMLNWIALGTTGSSGQGTDDKKTENTTINIKNNILIRNGDSWELRARKGVGPELKPRN
jgi:hypothetical protein